MAVSDLPSSSDSSPPDLERAAAQVEQTMRGLQARLEKSQWWPSGEMRQQQLRQLTTLVDHAMATVPFHAERLRQIGYAAGQPLDENTWSRVPILTRREVQSAGSAIISAALPADHGRIKELRTSGSTGMPVIVKVTTLAQLWLKAIVLREQLWHKRDLGLCFAVIRKGRRGVALPPDGERHPRWASRSAIPFETGPLVRLAIQTPVSEQVRWLVHNDPDYLLTYPPIWPPWSLRRAMPTFARGGYGRSQPWPRYCRPKPAPSCARRGACRSAIPIRPRKSGTWRCNVRSMSTCTSSRRRRSWRCSTPTGGRAVPARSGAWS
jgi:hypothetical protein